MYSWFIDYAYSFVIIPAFFLSPFYTFWLDTKFFNKRNKFREFVISFVISNIAIVLVLALRGTHVGYLNEICVNLPALKQGYTAPQGCYKFDTNKYMGVGWPVSAMFGTFFNFLYLIFVYTLWIVYDYMIKPKLAKKKPSGL